MDSAEIIIPAPTSITRKREETIERLKYAADSAERVMRRYADRKKTDPAQYYAGMRDAYLAAIKLLENE